MSRFELTPSEVVGIAVGNQLRLANAAFDRAIRRLQPKTLFEQIMQDLDDIESGLVVVELPPRGGADYASSRPWYSSLWTQKDYEAWRDDRRLWD